MLFPKQTQPQSLRDPSQPGSLLELHSLPLMRVPVWSQKKWHLQIQQWMRQQSAQWKGECFVLEGPGDPSFLLFFSKFLGGFRLKLFRIIAKWCYQNPINWPGVSPGPGRGSWSITKRGNQRWKSNERRVAWLKKVGMLSKWPLAIYTS